MTHDPDDAAGYQAHEDDPEEWGEVAGSHRPFMAAKTGPRAGLRRPQPAAIGASGASGSVIIDTPRT